MAGAVMTKKAPQVQIVRVPSFSPATKAKLKGVAKRGGQAAAALARDEVHTLTAMGAGAALGYIESRNVQVPHIKTLGISGTYGGVAWALGRYTKNKTMQHVATGLLACAVRDAVAASYVPPGTTPATTTTGAADGGMF